VKLSDILYENVNVPGYGQFKFKQISVQDAIDAEDYIEKANEKNKGIAFTQFVISRVVIEPEKTVEEIANYPADFVYALLEAIVDFLEMRDLYNKYSAQMTKPDALYCAWQEQQKAATEILRERITQFSKEMVNFNFGPSEFLDIYKVSLPERHLLVPSIQTSTEPSVPNPPHFTFVDPERIEQLRNIKSSEFDLVKLIQMCEELNLCFVNRCYFAVAMLCRGILDHVPPIFKVSSFTEVANNYNGTKSFKASMNHLENSSRKIADALLHQQIRAKEVLPNKTQVNFSSDLDVLLSELVRLLK
jgi:hypothetical protein